MNIKDLIEELENRGLKCIANIVEFAQANAENIIDVQHQSQPQNFDIEDATRANILAELHMHILSGEYISWFVPNSEGNRIKDLFDELTLVISSSFSEKNKEALKLCIRWLRVFALEIEGDFKHGYDSAGDRRVIFPEYDGLSQADLFHFNINIAQVDHRFFNYESLDELLKELVGIYQVIKDQSVDDQTENSAITKLLIEKCAFLIRKAILCHSEVSNHNAGLTHDGRTAVRQLSYPFSVLLFDDSFPLKYLNESLQVSNNHYLQGRPITVLTMKTIGMIGSGIPLNTLNEYHEVIKNYRENSSEESAKQYLIKLEKLKPIFDEFLGKIKADPQVNLFDLRATAKAREFFESAKAKITFQRDVGAPWGNVEGMIPYDNRRNFYPYRYVCKFYFKPKVHKLIGTLNEKISQGKSEVQLRNELILLVNRWDKCLNNWKDSLWEARMTNFIPFHLTLKESMLPLSSAPAKNFRLKAIFVASSYNLPFDHYWLQAELYRNIDSHKEANRELISIAINSGIWEAKEGTQDKAEQIAKETAEQIAKKEFKDQEIKAMQVLSIFVTIVTFTASGVGVSKVASTPDSALRFFAVFGTVMTLFLCFLLYMTNDGRARLKNNDEPPFKWKLPWICIVAFLAFMCFYILAGYLKSESPDKDNQKDSIAKTETRNMNQQQKIDSPGFQRPAADTDTSRLQPVAN